MCSVECINVDVSECFYVRIQRVNTFTGVGSNARLLALALTRIKNVLPRTGCGRRVLMQIKCILAAFETFRIIAPC